MLLHKKIRFLRLNKSWSQETMAEKLDMSPNGYGSIERGETNVQLSRVLQIAQLFDISISELFQDISEKDAINSMESHNVEIHNDNCFSASKEGLSQFEFQRERERQQLESDLEKKIIIIEHKDKEIFLLRQINELVTAKLIPHSTYYRRTHFTHKEEPRLQEQRKENVQRRETNLNNC